MKLRITVLVSCALMAACSGKPLKLVAPVDAYVCFPASEQCADDPVPTMWAPLLRSNLKDVTGESEVSLPVLASPYASDAVKGIGALPLWAGHVCPTVKKVIPIANGQLKIDGESDLHKSISIDRSGSCANYYSPLLISQLIEDLKKLSFAIDTCERTAQALDRQRNILGIEDEIADPDIAVDLTMSALSRKDMERLSLPKAQIDDYSENKETIISGKDKIRSQMRAQILDYDYINRMSDAVLRVELAYGGVERQLFLITKTSVVECGDTEKVTPLVRSGDWVTKGTDVLSVKRRGQ
ncbi:hypothetical protein [Pseudoxanthomonas sp. SE1]|uniref:hypothetical protein n=1 Tax=Pseudoxanthomonas sp. SE1 TaxID=1664560 RepID=UPI00240DBFAA|nr:hypothetical protein [Pseudoxanthomonas sp. SE1]WFC40821.1 hypothetical protein OY559_13505 [Pseudoxanthomonas sp. SE1]